MGWWRAGIAGRLLSFLGGLRFPVLFLVALGLFVIDLVVPDAVPLMDEMLLGVTTLLLGRVRKSRREAAKK